jgi:hypothetical protein
MEKIIFDFFNRVYETKINNHLLELNYQFQKEEFLEYLRSIIEIDITEYLNWLDNHTFFTIEAKDMPQLSDFNDAFYNVVYQMLDAGDNGFRYVEIGELLQNDGIHRNDMANRKYGENHAKAAEYLGYLFSIKYHYYVSCIGYVLIYLTEEEKNKLYSRLLIRTNLFRAIYNLSKSGSFSLRMMFDILSDKTYIRRLTSTKVILNKLEKSNEYLVKDKSNNR